MPAIPITTLTAHYDASPYLAADRLTVNSHHLKGAFVDHLKRSHADQIERGDIDLTTILNKDADGRRVVSYPLLQFRLGMSVLQIVGVRQGADALDVWIESALAKDGGIPLSRSQLSLSDVEQTTYRWRPHLSPSKLYLYRLHRWKPYSSTSLKQQRPLRDLLFGQIMRILDDLDIALPARPQIKLLQHRALPPVEAYDKTHRVRWKVYHAMFISNVHLPDHIGVGHESRLGFGRLERIDLNSWDGYGW